MRIIARGRITFILDAAERIKISSTVNMEIGHNVSNISWEIKDSTFRR